MGGPYIFIIFVVLIIVVVVVVITIIVCMIIQLSSSPILFRYNLIIIVAMIYSIHSFLFVCTTYK